MKIHFNFKIKLLLSIVTLIFLSGLTNSFSQNLKIELLEKSLKKSRSDTNTVNILYKLGSEYWVYDFEKGFDYSKKCLVLSKKLKYAKGIAQAQTNIGLYYYFMGDYQKAMKKYRLGIDILGEKIYSDFPSTTLTHIGNLYRVQGLIDSANYYYDRSLENMPSEKSNIPLSSVYYNKGLTFIQLANYDSALVNINKSLSLRNKLKDSLLIAESWKGLGMVYLETDQYDSAQYYFNRMINIGEVSNNPEIKIFYKIYMGELLYKKSDFPNALESIKQALVLLNDHDFIPLQIDSHFLLGRIYSDIGEFEKALQSLLDAERLNRKLNNIKKDADISYEMSYVYYLQKNTNAKEYALKTRRMYKELGLKKMISSTNNLLGNIELDAKNFDASIAFYNLSLEAYTLLNHLKGIAAVKYNLSLVFVEQGFLQKALKYQLEALKIEKEIGHKLGIIISYNYLGKLYREIGNFKESETYLLKCKELLIGTSSIIHKEENARYLAELYTDLKKHEKANEFYKESRRLSDSLFLIENLNISLRLASVYELEKKELEIDNLNEKQEANLLKLDFQELKLRQQKIFIIFTVIIILFFIGLSYMLIRSKRKLKSIQNKLIKTEKRASLSILTSGLFHEINNPLNFIQTGVTVLREEYKPDEGGIQIINYIEEGIQRITHILKVLSQFQNQFNSEFSKCNIITILNESINALKHEIKDDIQIIFLKNEKPLHTFGNKDQIMHLFVEIIRNAIQSINGSGEISISIKPEKSMCILNITDNGKGIKANHLSMIENPFFTTKDPDIGKGLGLYIADYIVNEHKGEIIFDSKPGIGTSVIIKLPKI